MAIVTVGFNPAIDRILECPDFHVGGHQQARQIARLASGKAANVSRALAQLGIDSVATGFVGTADLPFFLEQLQAASGSGKIACHFVKVAGTTRENITILDPKRHAETHIRDRGFVVTPDEISQLERQLRQDLAPGDVAIFSGSLCQGLPDHYFASVIDLCASLQVRVVVDTNGTPLKDAVNKKTWMLKPNLEELRELLGREVPNASSAIRDAAMQLLDNVEFMLISRGKHGAILLSRAAGAYSARSVLMGDAVRTVGCGDHLLAGFVAEITKLTRMGAGAGGAAVAMTDVVERSLRSAMALATARALSARLDVVDSLILTRAAAAVEIEKI